MTPDPDFYQRYELNNSFEIYEKNSDFYTAHDRLSDRQVLVRVFRPDMPPKNFSQNTWLWSRFNIPHLSHIIDFGITDNDQLFHTTPLPQGISMLELLSYDLSLDSLFKIIFQLIDAIHTLHLHGLSHLNIKPENIFVTLNDEDIFAVLVDPGIPTSNFTPSLCGLISPPELRLGLETMTGPSTDVFMIAAILCHAIQSQERSPSQFDEDSFPWRSHLIDYPAEVQGPLLKLLKKALAPYPYKRFLSALDFKHAMELIPLQNSDVVKEMNTILSQSSISKSFTKRKTSFNSHLDTFISSQSWSSNSNGAPNSATPISSSSSSWHEVKKSIKLSLEKSSELTPSTQKHPTPERQKEYDQLITTAENALQGTGAFCLISGNHGSGKSRLLRIFTEQFIRTNFTSITCSCNRLDYPDPSDTHPFLISLRLVLSLFSQLNSQVYTDGHSSFTPRSSLREDGLWDDDDDNLVEEISALSDQIIHSPNLIQKDDTKWMHIFPLILRLVQEASCIAPLCIVLEDIQRCTLPIFQFLLYLAKAAHHLPMIILASYNPDELNIRHEQRSISEHQEFSPLFENEIHLAPLEPDAIIQMLKTTWHIDEKLGKRVADKSYGNPYYAVSLVQHLGQQSRLRKNKAGLFTLSSHDERAIGIPAHLFSFFQHQLSSLSIQIGAKSEIYFDILCRISVFGIQVNLRELEAFWDYEKDKLIKDNWREAVSTWCDLNVLDVSQFIPSEGKTSAILYFIDPFHADILQSMIPQSKRYMLKEQAALSLIECHDKPTSDQAWHIADLWKEAQNLPTFIQYCSQSCELAMDEGKLSSANEHSNLLRTLIQNELNSDNPSSDVLHAIDWGAFLLKRAEMDLLLDDEKSFDRSCELLKSWGEHSNSPVHTTHIQRLTALKHLRQDNFERACGIATIARDNFLITHQLIEAHKSQTILATAELKLGEIQKARLHFEESLPVLKSKHAYTESAHILYCLSKLEWFACHFGKARTYLHEALQMLRENRNRRLLDQYKMFEIFTRYIETLDALTLDALSGLYVAISQQGDRKAKSEAEVMLMLSQLLQENWEFIHDLSQRYAQIPKLHIHDGIVLGTLSCLKAIEQAFNGEVNGSYTEITMALACFGPQNKRARAWCHLLLGGISIVERQYEQGLLSFDKARDEFEALNDEIGLLCVRLGQCALATSCKKLSKAKELSSQIIKDIQGNPISLFDTISTAIQERIKKTRNTPQAAPIDIPQELLDDEDEIADLKRMVDE